MPPLVAFYDSSSILLTAKPQESHKEYEWVENLQQRCLHPSCAWAHFPDQKGPNTLKTGPDPTQPVVNKKYLDPTGTDRTRAAVISQITHKINYICKNWTQPPICKQTETRPSRSTRNSALYKYFNFRSVSFRNA